jgi:uncharacterized membrane protein
MAAVLNAVVIAAMFALALLATREIPPGAQVAIHWGPDGEPDAWMGEQAGFLIVPVIAFVLWFLLSIFPQVLWLPRTPLPPAEVRRTMFSRILLILFAVQVMLALGALHL